MRAATALVLLLAALLLLACGGPKSKARAKPPTRDELRAALVGKTKEEVIAKLGRPESTREYASGDVWTYEEASYDPVADKTDLLTYVHFDRRGAVERLAFFRP